MALLPIEALRAWREGAGEDAGSARALATRAELSRVLVSTGLVALADVSAALLDAVEVELIALHETKATRA